MERKIIYNGKVIGHDRVYENGAVVIDKEGLIEEIIEINGKGKTLENILNNFAQENRINAEGGVIAPGSIAIHEHGLIGYEFIGISEDNLEKLLEGYPKFGVTRVSPTLVTAPLSDIENTLQTIQNVAKKQTDGKIYGATLSKTHLECWYFNKELAGAHDTSLLENPDFNNFFELMKKAFYTGIITLAPELNNGIDFIRKINSMFPDIILSIGHSNATMEQASLAFDLGVRLINHIYNRISQEKDATGHRADLDEKLKNVVKAALKDERVYVELVCDFVHLNEERIKEIIDRKGFDKTILITDSSAMAGSKKKRGTLGGRECVVLKKDGYPAPYYIENGKPVLAGSLLTMDQAIRNVKSLRNIYHSHTYKLDDIFKSVSSTPAKLLRIDEYTGSIEPKKLADIAVYEYNQEHDTIGKVLYTFAKGNIVYPSNREQGT